MAEEEEATLSEARKLPLAERVSHKNWKARGEAYDSIAAACERAFDSDGVLEYGVCRTCRCYLVHKGSTLVSIFLYTLALPSLTQSAGTLQALTWQNHQWTAMRPPWTRH